MRAASAPRHRAREWVWQVADAPTEAVELRGRTATALYRRSRFPWWLGGLFLAVFGFFTDDYIIAGILPDVADGLGVSESMAGQLVTAFSLTVAIATPIAGFVLARVPRRVVVLGALAWFVTANAVAAQVTGFPLLMGLRVVAGLAAAAALPVVFAAAADLSPDSRRGRHLGILSVGITGAVAVGVPLGATIAGAYTWAHTFGFMAACGVLAFVLVAVTFPGGPPTPPVPFRAQLRILAARQISMALLGGAVALLGSVMFITYLAPYLVGLLGRDDMRAEVFAVFGVAATLGVFAGGWSVDRFGADNTLIGGMVAFIGMMAVFTGLWLLRPVPVAAFFPLVVLWGAFAYWSNTAVQVRLHALAGPLTAQALALNTSLCTLGIAVGAALGGVVVGVGGIGVLPAVTGLACVVGLVLLMVAFRGAPTAPAGSEDHARSSPKGE